MNVFSRSFAIVLTIGLIYNQAYIGQAAPQKASRPSTPDSPNAQVTQLKARLTKAIAQKEAAEAEMGRYTIFTINGEVQSGDARSIRVYGTVFGTVGTTGQEFGWLREKSFFEVLQPDPKNLLMSRYYGPATFLYSRYGSNVYGPAPVAYQQAVIRRKQSSDLEDALRLELDNQLTQIQYQKQQQAIIAKERQRQAQYKKNLPLFKAKTSSFLTSFQQAQQKQGANATFYYASAHQAIELYNTLGKNRYDAPALSNHAVVSLLRSAVYEAEAGRLDKSVEVLKEASYLTPSKVGGLFGLKFQSGKQSAYFRTALTRNPVVLRRLTDAWLNQLPRYIEQPAPTSQKAQVVEAASRLSTLLSPLEAQRYSQSLTRLVERTQTLEMAPAEGTVNGSRITRRPLNSDAPASSSGRPSTGSNAPTSTTQSTSTSPEIRVTPERLTALDFRFKSLDGTVQQLSDFKGRVVILYFWPLSEEDAASPTPLEQINRFVRECNGRGQTSSQVVLIAPGLQNYDYALTSFLDKVQQPQGKRQRDYPQPLTRFYAPKAGQEDESQATNDPNEFSRIGQFYRFDGFNTLKAAIVIDGEGKVVGAVPFVSFGDLSERFSLNTKKLEALIQAAFTKKAPTP